jgi:hypothetical protein
MRKIELWHPMAGRWVHIQQIDKDGIRHYYTDGKPDGVRKINDDGTINAYPQASQKIGDVITSEQ